MQCFATDTTAIIIGHTNVRRAAFSICLSPGEAAKQYSRRPFLYW